MDASKGKDRKFSFASHARKHTFIYDIPALRGDTAESKVLVANFIEFNGENIFVWIPPKYEYDKGFPTPEEARSKNVKRVATFLRVGTLTPEKVANILMISFVEAATGDKIRARDLGAYFTSKEYKA